MKFPSSIVDGRTPYESIVIAAHSEGRAGRRADR